MQACLESTTETAPAVGATEQQFVFVALPCRPGPHFRKECREAEARGHIALTRPTERGKMFVSQRKASLLCYSFNKLWARMMNAWEADGELTHFAMQHDDIVPPPLWVDVCADLADEHKAAACSAVVKIKDARELTSTAIRNSESGNTRRLTMKEVMRLPETFCLQDVYDAGIAEPQEGDLLAVNTGLWVARLAPWCKRFTGFAMTDAVKRLPNGRWAAGVVPEDWQFSEWLAARGQKVIATRAVTTAHIDGDGKEWRTDEIGDGWETDTGDDPDQ